MMKNKKQSKRISKHLEQVNLFAAGIDIKSSVLSTHEKLF
jgi:hypothetical protein